MSGIPPSGVDFFSEDLLVHADKAFQFVYGLTFDREYSSACVYATFEAFAADLPVPAVADDLGLVTVLQGIWSQISSSSFMAKQVAEHSHSSATKEVGDGDNSDMGEGFSDAQSSSAGGFSDTPKPGDLGKGKHKGDITGTEGSGGERLLFQLVLSGLTLKERAVLILCDHFGLTKKECALVIHENHENVLLKQLAHARMQLMAQSF